MVKRKKQIVDYEFEEDDVEEVKEDKVDKKGKEPEDDDVGEFDRKIDKSKEPKDDIISRAQISQEDEGRYNIESDRGVHRKISKVASIKVSGDIVNPRIIISDKNGNSLFSVPISRRDITPDEAIAAAKLYLERLSTKIYKAHAMPSIGQVDANGYTPVAYSPDLIYVLFRDLRRRYTIENNETYSEMSKVKASNDSDAKRVFSKWLSQNKG